MGPVAAVVGVGVGIGGALARKWAKEGFRVACISRSDKCHDFATECGNDSKGYVCDVTNRDALSALIHKIEYEMGPIEAVLWNVGTGIFTPYDQVDLDSFETGFKTNVSSLLQTAQLVLPDMRQRKSGVIAITGATASLRGKPMTAGFAPHKCAQRALAQSLAKTVGKDGVHVFYVIIDGMVDLPTSRYENWMQPDDIADAYWHVANQKKSAWTHEIDLRPNTEEW